MLDKYLDIYLQAFQKIRQHRESTAPHHTTPHRTTLHCTALHYTTLHCTTTGHNAVWIIIQVISLTIYNLPATLNPQYKSALYCTGQQNRQSDHLHVHVGALYIYPGWLSKNKLLLVFITWLQKPIQATSFVSQVLMANTILALISYFLYVNSQVYIDFC